MRKRKFLTYALFVAIAMILVLSAYIIKKLLSADFTSEILLQIGLVIGTIVLVDWLWGLVGGEPLAAQIDELKSLYELQRDADRTGLAGIYLRGNELNVSYWEKQILECKSNIDMVAETAFEISEQVRLMNAIVDRIKHGVKVRILINSPSSLLTWFVDYEDPDLEGMHMRMEQAWRTFQRVYTNLPPRLQSHFQVAKASEGGRFHNRDEAI